MLEWQKIQKEDVVGDIRGSFVVDIACQMYRLRMASNA
jgi:hypothetical protein